MKKILPLLFLSCSSQAADHVTPFFVTDMSPLSLGYSLPAIAGAAPAQAGSWRWQLNANVSNTLHIENRGDESLLVDAETSRHTISADYGLTEQLGLRVEVPYIRHEAGSLDDFIDDFHSALGFPEGNRPVTPNDQFAVRYERGGQTLIDIQQAQSGIGDISLALLGQTAATDGHSFSYGVQLKLPTGEETELTGSGTSDIAAWVAASKALTSSLEYYAAVGGVYIEPDKGLLADIRKDGYFFARYGVDWRVSQVVSLRLQLDYQSAIYKTDTRLLGHSTAITSGGTLYLGNDYALDIAVVEDIDVGTSSDVVFHLGLRKGFGS